LRIPAARLFITMSAINRRKPFSQLWAEDEQYLREQASLLGEKAVLGEIGTAQGASAYLFATSAEAKNISVYTYDLFPSDEAVVALKGLNVRIIGQSSVAGAGEWTKKYGKGIDLLFIDGSHTLENVYVDFISWSPHVKTDGKILLHDYDPPSRGGFAHLGVKVLIDAVKNLNILRDVEHTGKIFAGRKKEDARYEPLAGECFHVWKNIGKRFGKFSGFDFEKELKSLKDKVLKSDENLFPCDEVMFFYLLYDSILNNRNKILEITENKSMYFKWEEILQMHNHATDCGRTMEDAFAAEDEDIKSISKACAREQVRMHILKNIFSAIVGKR